MITSTLLYWLPLKTSVLIKSLLLCQFQFGQICVCDLAQCITQSNSEFNLLERLSVEEVLMVLRKIGDSLVTTAHFNGRRKKKSVREACKKITKYVEERCGCIFFNIVINKVEK